MNIHKINYRGTEINKINFFDLEDLLEEKGLYKKVMNEVMDEESGFVYISNGFLYGLKQEETQPNEWHHFFTKQHDGSFECEKFTF